MQRIFSPCFTIEAYASKQNLLTSLRILDRFPPLLEANMARVTVEDCLKNVDNRFALVHLTAKRAKEITKGAAVLHPCDNKEIVTSLREIADNSVRQKRELKK
jgi:DNA-directed RNA polymerase subunit omega